MGGNAVGAGQSRMFVRWSGPSETTLSIGSFEPIPNSTIDPGHGRTIDSNRQEQILADRDDWSFFPIGESGYYRMIRKSVLRVT